MARRSNEGSGYGEYRQDECIINLKLFLNLGVTFIVTLCVFIGLLYISACIPKETFRDNLLESAKWLEENEDEFYALKAGDERTVIDNYADSIMYNIMYSVDSQYRLESLMISPFYSDNTNPEYQMITLLRDRIENEKEIDTVYDRYWHGMQIFLRPLFVVFELLEIRVLLISILVIGLFFLMYVLWKKEQRALALSMVPAAVFISYPMLGMSIEYVSTFLIMLLVSGVCITYYKDIKKVICILLVSGMCCGFFDILTTETVAVVIPLAIILCLREKEEGFHNFWKELGFVILSGVVWGIGYLGVFISKWCFSSFYLKSNRFLPAISMMIYRQGAEVATEDGNSLSQPLEALARNFRLLAGFPSEMKYEVVLMIMAVIVGGLACFVYLYRKTGKECILPALLLLLALVPVARILILNSHSYQHSYFTYRALFASISCTITAIIKVLDINLIKTKK